MSDPPDFGPWSGPRRRQRRIDTRPPEGKVIEAARQRLGLTQAQAGVRCGFTSSRWRNNVNGHVKTAVGVWALMARAVGLGPEDFAAVRIDLSLELLGRSGSEGGENPGGLVARLVHIIRAVGVKSFQKAALQAVRQVEDADEEPQPPP